MKNLKLILWKDASGLQDSDHNEWFTLIEAVKKAQSLWEECVETVGWIISETDNYVVIASTKSNDVYSDISMIPKVLIFKSTEVI